MTVLHAVSHPTRHPVGQLAATVTVGVTEQCGGGHGAVVVSRMMQSGSTQSGIKGHGTGRVTVDV